jgi:hypothetical protein
MKAKLRDQVEKIDDELQCAQQRRDAVLSMSMEEITAEYLEAITRCAELWIMVAKNLEPHQKYEIAKLRIHDAAEMMAIRGYPEAVEREVSDSYDGIIVRILSIRNGGGVCYDVHNLAGVMNAIKNLGEDCRNDHSIYLIAEKTYWGVLGIQTKWFVDWVAKVREAVRLRDSRYLRDGKYDKLLSLLFPEMAHALADGFGAIRGRVGRLNQFK